MSADHPFTAVHSQRLFVLTESRREALTRLEAGFGEREPFLVVTGDPGTGKTALVLEAIARWGARATAAFVANPALTRTELLEEIARRFGAEPTAGASKPQLIACLEHALAENTGRGQVAVLVIEDAHDLEHDLLEELRSIAAAQSQAGRNLEIVLVGLPSLAGRLDDPACAGLRQRVSVQCHLDPLTHKDTRRYLHHRVGAVGGDGPRLFPRKASSEIHARAHGIPRAVNLLASEAMRRAQEAGAQAVTSDHVRAASEILWPTTGGRRVVDDSAADEPEVLTPRPAPARPNGRAVETSHPHEAPKREPAGNGDGSAPEERSPAATRNGGETHGRPAAEHSNGGGAEEPTASVPADGKAEDPAATEAPRPPGSDDVRVRAWVTRFVGDQGPPRIGSRVRWASEDAHAQQVADAFQVKEADPAAPPDPFATADPATAPPPVPRPRPQRRASWSPPRPLIVGVVVVATLATLIALPQSRRMFRANALTTRSTPRTSPAAAPYVSIPTPVAAPVESVAIDNAVQVKTPLSTPVPVEKPPSAPAEITVAANDVAPGPDSSTNARKLDPASHSSARFTIEVAGMVDPSRARDERDRLSADSGLDGWVFSVSRDGVHFVLLGVFSSERRAEAAASLLVSRGVLAQARVVPLPPRRLRH